MMLAYFFIIAMLINRHGKFYILPISIYSPSAQIQPLADKGS